MGSQTLLHVIHPQNSFRNLLVLRFRDLRSRSCLTGTWIPVLGILFLRSTGLAVSGPVICVFHNFLFFVDRVMSLLCMGSQILLHPVRSPKLFRNVDCPLDLWESAQFSLSGCRYLSIYSLVLVRR